MKAAVLRRARTVEIMDVPEPGAVSGSVVVAVERCGIGGPDLVAWKTGESPAPAWFGHEWVGKVIEVGSRCPPERFEGERVVGAVPPPCGRCRACVAGIGSICELVLSMIVGTDSLAGDHGAFAERIRVDARRVHRLPEGVDESDGALAEPAAVAAHAVRRAQPSLGDTVVVVGAGTVGLLVAELARLAGASRVAAVDLEPDRQELACSLGADAAFSPGRDLDTWLGGQGHGLGADVVFECAGGSRALTTAVGAVRPGGSVILVGFTPESATIPARQVLHREITVRGSLGYSITDVHRALDLMADERYRVSALYDRIVGFGDLAEEFERLERCRPARPKVLFQPGV